MTPGIRAALVALLVAVSAAGLSIIPLLAHKPITSKYTYNEDVFPVFRDRCGRCHVTGGVGPMSLLTYKDAYPWAESIRTELLIDKLPPWHASEGLGPGNTLIGRLSPRELDVMLVWATGGTPQGSAANAPQPAAFKNEWPLGEPGLTLPAPEPFVLAADKQDGSHEFILDTGLTRARRITSIDLRPGNPAIVRYATIGLAPRPGTSRVVQRTAAQGNQTGAIVEWTPGGGASKPRLTSLPAGARLLVTIKYKRTWLSEGSEVSDRSTVGVYFREPR